MNGKGSKKRVENFALIQKNWAEIDWKRPKKSLIINSFPRISDINEKGNTLPN